MAATVYGRTYSDLIGVVYMASIDGILGSANRGSLCGWVWLLRNTTFPLIIAWLSRIPMREI